MKVEQVAAVPVFRPVVISLMEKSEYLALKTILAAWIRANQGCYSMGEEFAADLYKELLRLQT